MQGLTLFKAVSLGTRQAQYLVCHSIWTYRINKRARLVERELYSLNREGRIWEEFDEQRQRSRRQCVEEAPSSQGVLFVVLAAGKHIA